MDYSKIYEEIVETALTDVRNGLDKEVIVNQIPLFKKIGVDKDKVMGHDIEDFLVEPKDTPVEDDLPIDAPKESPILIGDYAYIWQFGAEGAEGKNNFFKYVKAITSLAINKVAKKYDIERDHDFYINLNKRFRLSPHRAQRKKVAGQPHVDQYQDVDEYLISAIESSIFKAYLDWCQTSNYYSF